MNFRLVIQEGATSREVHGDLKQIEEVIADLKKEAKKAEPKTKPNEGGE